MTKFHIAQLLLVFIIILGFSIRIYNISGNPAGFFADEASIGYNAYLLAHSGKDEHGARFSVFFRSFGDYRPPIPFYSAIPYVLLFGLSEFAVRLATVTAATITIVLVFIFVYQILIKNISQMHAAIGGLFAALFLAISPWHIHMSRFGSEYVYLPLFTLLSLIIWFVALKKSYLLPLSTLALSLIGYTYLPGVIIGPIVTLSLFVIWFRYLVVHFRWTLLALCVYLICLLPTMQALINRTLLTRWNNVGFTKRIPFTDQVSVFAKQYWKHFSPTFLFTKGDLDYPGHFIRRFGIKNQGELYFVDIPFLIAGFLYFAREIRYKNKSAILPFLLLALYPIGSSITTTDGGGPLAFRSVLGSIVFPIFSGAGIVAFFQLLSNRRVQMIFVGVILCIYGIFLTHYLYLYHTHYPQYSEDFWGWQFGPRDVMRYFLSQKDSYDNLYLIGMFNSPEIFIRFYDPNNLCQHKCQIGDISKFDPRRKQLFAIGADTLQSTKEIQFSLIKTIQYSNGSPAFYIGEFVR